MDNAKPDSQPINMRIGDRFQVQEVLGRGGMGAVYRVLDQANGQTLALKQLQKARAETRPEDVMLFQHEYHTLVQLAHPFVIEVYDYGVDQQGPYYTMELLTGTDLRQMAPLEWRQACALLRDVASGLAILHSRRLVHRDVTSRNVRCTDKGRAKLIDFGAMIPMGAARCVVGTPPFLSPEALNCQPMDGRADLFSLGAVAYHLLTGRHAFAARKMGDLRDLWRSKLTPPTAVVPQIPPALDALVTSLLSLDRLARPVNAAEVIDRLTAIAALPEAEPLQLSQAYLTTPPLVGRGQLVTRYRKFVSDAFAGRGGTVMVQGAAGVGRSRLLSSYVLEGKLAGATVITATAEDARRGDYGVVRALVDELLEAAPSETLEAAEQEATVLGHVLPALHDKMGRPELVRFEDQQQLRARSQVALHSLFTLSAVQRCLMIAVDDVHRCDEPSAAVLAALSGNAHRLKLALAVTAETDGRAQASKAVQMLGEAGTCIELEALGPDDSRRLIGSMFGDVPNLNLVADWAYELSQGNPRTCMELVQHLVDRGMARYEDGRWILPANLRDQDLPQSLEQALDARIAKLTEGARGVAEALSLVTEHAPLKLDHYVFLSPSRDPKVVFAALDELVASQVLVRTGEHYLFTQRGLVEALHRGLGDERRRQIHARLAVAYESGDYDRPLIFIYHLQQADQGRRALQLLVPLIKGMGAVDEPFPLQVQCCEAALALAERQGNAPRDRYVLRRRLIEMARSYDVSLLRHADKAVEQLRKDSGLVFWDQLDNALEPSERVQHCLKMALESWEATPESEKGLNPTEAVQQLAVCVAVVAAAVGPTLDADMLSSLARLLDPFRSVGPAVDLVGQMLEVARDAVLGHSVNEKRRSVVEATRQPVYGVEDEIRKSLNLGHSYYLGLTEASYASPLALKRANMLETDPRFVAHAWQLRVVTHLYAGNAEKARSCREHRELLAIQNPESQSHLMAGLVFEAWACGMSGDLMGLKQILVPIAENASRYPGWLPFMLAVRGDYHRLRGELGQARADLEHMLALAPIGKHFAWHRGLPVLVETLLEMGRTEEARELALRSLETCLEVSPYPDGVRELNRVLALADAKLGSHEQAFERIEATIEKAKAEGVGGVPLGTLYETGAWIALGALDEDAFNLYAEATAEQYRPGKNPALVAKFQKLLEETALYDMRTESDLEDGMTFESDSGSTETAMTVVPQLRHALEECQSAESRAQVALSLLLQHTGARAGYLYTLEKTGLVFVAPLNTRPPPDLLSRLTEYLKELTDTDPDTAATGTVQSQSTTGEYGDVLVTDDGYTFQPILLRAQRGGSSAITGVAALRVRQGTTVSPAWNVIATIGEYIMPGLQADE